ncbi:MAG: hypothetical protein JWP97_633 [Labilithrix sp.]|nr:hypothetical protein [Labilithrix sp.]
MSLRRVISLGVLSFVVAAAVACSDSETAGSTSPTGDGGACTAALDTFVCPAPAPGTFESTWCCPPSFDATAEALPACNLGERQSYSACPGARVLTRSFGTHAIQCFYSVTTDALVAAQKEDDVEDLCGGTSSVATSGNAPAAGCTPDSLTQVTCPRTPDGGSDGGADASADGG